MIFLQKRITNNPSSDLLGVFNYVVTEENANSVNCCSRSHDFIHHFSNFSVIRFYV